MKYPFFEITFNNVYEIINNDNSNEFIIRFQPYFNNYFIFINKNSNNSIPPFFQEIIKGDEFIGNNIFNISSNYSNQIKETTNILNKNLNKNTALYVNYLMLLNSFSEKNIQLSFNDCFVLNGEKINNKKSIERFEIINEKIFKNDETILFKHEDYSVLCTKEKSIK